MAFNFKIQFAGLCHFIENGDPTQRCQLCVVVPEAPARVFSPRHHEPKLAFPTSALATKPDPDSDPLRVELLRAKRVTFRYTLADGKKLPKPKLRKRLKNTLAVEQLVDTNSEYVDFAKDARHPDISAKVLLEAGTLTEAAPTGKWKLRDRSEKVAPMGLPPFVMVTVRGVEKVEVIITPIGGGEPKTLVFADPATPSVAITITADCDFLEEGSPETTAIFEDTPDKDFGAHYRLFPDLAKEAPKRLVPLQLAPDAKAAKRFNTKAAARRAGFARRLEIKPPPPGKEVPPAGGGGGLNINASNGSIAPTGSGGGSACQNGRSLNETSFQMDSQLPTN